MRSLHLEPDEVFLGAYKIERLIGRGSMGAVYKAQIVEDGRTCALKLLSPEALRDEKSLARFEREATVSAQVRSEHIVKTWAAGVAGGMPWLIMEYVEGKLLDDVIAAQPSAEHRRRILEQLFEGVAAVHDAGFVHRDLKPDNIIVLLAPGGPSIKILDFGVAKRLGVSPNNSTAQGLGTPLWTAPEQASSSRGLQPSADVWALGLLVFYILTGIIYWKGAQPKASMIDLLLELSRGDIVPASQRAAELGFQGALPASFDAWFAHCVHRNPAARFADAREALAHLRDVLDGRPSALPPRLSLPALAAATPVPPAASRGSTPPPGKVSVPPPRPGSVPPGPVSVPPPKGAPAVAWALFMVAGGVLLLAALIAAFLAGR